MASLSPLWHVSDLLCLPHRPCLPLLCSHRNSSLRPWLINTMFLGKATGGGNKAVSGFYVDDGWRTTGPR
eukprot:COSAG01_NODE_650_length_14506_cov_24.157354_16_plen_70_part_00